MIYIYSLYYSVICCVFIGYLLSFVPNNVDLAQYKQIIIPEVLAECKPERAENLQYYLLTILFPVLYLCFIFVFRKISKKSPMMFTEKKYSIWEFVSVFIVGILIILVLKKSDTPYDYINNYYCYGYGLPVWLLSALLIVFPLWLGDKTRRKTLCGIIYWMLAAAILVFAFVRISSKNYMATDDYYLTHHYYAWWYPIFKVSTGQTIGIDFNNIYGFYPYICVGVLKLLGGANQENAAILIASLLVIIGFCYYLFSFVFFKNKILAFIAATGACFLAPFDLFKNRFYIQYFPTRAIVPAVAMIMISVDYILKNNKAKSFFRFFACLVFAFGLFWNFESGIIGVIVWAGYIILEKAFDYGFDSKNLWIAIAKAIVTSVLSIAVFLITVEIITYQRAGKLIGKDEIFFGILTFEGKGFFLLPITFGVWILIIISFVSALNMLLPKLALAAEKGKKFDGDRQNLTALFTLVIIGFGAFSYFVGRSYPTNVFVLIYVSVLIVALLIEAYYPQLKEQITLLKVKNSNRKLSAAHAVSISSKIIICMLVLGFSTSNAAMIMLDSLKNGANSAFDNYWVSDTKKDPDYTRINELAGEIKTWSEKENDGKNPRLLIYWAAFVNEINHEKTNYSACEQIDWFYYDNVKTYVDCINDDKTQAFVIDTQALSKISECCPDYWQEAVKNYRLAKVIKWDDISAPGEQEYYIFVPIQK